MKMLELLSDPTKWIQGAFARDADGVNVSSQNKEAVCWCLQGALIRCYVGSLEYSVVKNKIIKELVLVDFARWNDDPSRTYQDVQTLLQKLDI